MEEEAKQDGATGMLRLRIAKKAYVFDVKKKYAPTRTFNVKKKAETPLEELGADLALMMRKKEGEKKPQEAPARQNGEKKPQGAPILKIVVGAILIFFLLVAYVIIQVGNAPAGTGAAPPPMVFSGGMNAQVEQKNVLSVDNIDEPKQEGYLLLSYEAQNLSGLNFSAFFYKDRPTTQLFVLDYARENADSYYQFMSELKKKLSAEGIMAEEIGLEGIALLPEGATLLVPTGYFPVEMLDGGQGADYRSLLSRGVNIIYIGMPFDSMALERSGVTTQASHTFVIFSKNRPESADGFRLFDAQYTVSGVKDQESGAKTGTLYGSVSTLTIGKGTMFFLPQFLDMGWQTDQRARGHDRASDDIAMLMGEQEWMDAFATANATGVLAEGNRLVSMYSSPYDEKTAFVKLVADAMDENGIGQKKLDVFRLEKGQKGDIVPREPLAVPYYLSGQKTRLGMSLHEASNNPVKLYIAMYRDGKEMGRNDLENGLTNPTIERSVDFQVDSEPGDYNLEVIDSSGKKYAATRLSVAGMDVRENSTNWQTGNFKFFLSSAGKPVSPSSLLVTFDGRGQRTYTPSEIIYSGGRNVLDYTYGGKIDAGPHVFNFTTDKFSTIYPMEYTVRKFFWDDPKVLVLGVLSLLVFGVGILLKRQEAPRYGLDVPDFPPLATIKIPMKRETVLEIFDTVNLRYAWKWMPLRLPEIKNGFGKLTYNGKPILVGDFNLERILVKLREEGLVKNELDYWGRSSWEGESNHSTHYLTVYRIMRNIFVNNAVKFSKSDSMPDCDVKALAGKEEMYMHIMEEPYERVVHRALATSGKGQTIIVFKTEEELEALKARLTSTSKLAVALKIEVNNKSITLLPVKNYFSAFLKQKIV